jgi:hypothetical protein
MQSIILKGTVYAAKLVAKYQKMQCYFNLKAERIKAEFIHLAAWLSILGG